MQIAIGMLSWRSKNRRASKGRNADKMSNAIVAIAKDKRNKGTDINQASFSRGFTITPFVFSE